MSFASLSTSLSQLRWQDKIKTIEHISKCDTLINSCYFNISHSLTCPKTWEKGLKRLKYLKIIIFCRSKHSTLLTLIKNSSKFLINYIQKKRARFINDCKVWCFSQGDGIVTQNRITPLNATRNTVNASSSSLLTSSNNSKNVPQSFLKDLRINNINHLIIGQLNINFFRNKFEQLSTMIIGNNDILMISEAKLEETFPAAQFLL